MEYRQGCMEKNTRNLLLSELVASSSYLERIFMAVLEVPTLQKDYAINDECKELYHDLCCFFEDNLFLPQYRNSENIKKSIDEIIQYFKDSNQLIISFLKFDQDEEYTIKLVIEYINLLYEYSYGLHLRCDDFGNIEILFPRTSLALSNKDTEDYCLPKFHLSFETFYNFKDSNAGPLESLIYKRKNIYEKLLSEGHKEVYNESYEVAIDKFKKASMFIETAEVLTLLGWVFSLQHDLEKAKTYCLKAIKLDPSYGPPYNDIGTYLLTENQVNDSLKWFNMAKKAAVYQNREYPYINSGRAYLSQKKNALALDEFSKALTLAPYHTELHETISKLKESLDKENGLDLENFKLCGTLKNNNSGSTFHEWT